MARKTKKESEETRQALLDSAAMLFMRQGVAKTTLQDIANHAKVTRGAVYWHFNNKDVLIQVLWERNAGEPHQRFLQQLGDLRTSAAPDRVFRDAITGIVQHVARQPNLGQAIRIAMHCVEFTNEQSELQRFLRSRRNELHGGIQRAILHLERRGLLTANLPPKVLTQSLMSYLFGVVNTYLEPGHHPLNLAQDGIPMLNLVLDGMLPPATNS